MPMKQILLNFKTSVYIPLLAILTLAFSCTSNPFFDNKVDSNVKRSVKGTVRLNDGEVPENIYVWLEGFNLSARTDRTGKFKITLPLPQMQPGGGLTGIYKLYYYMGNYVYQTSSLLVRNGRFAYDAEDIDSQGKIIKTITLQKLLDIKTIIEPDTIVLMKDTTETIGLLSKTGADTVWADTLSPQVTVRISLTPKRRNVRIKYYKLDENESACAGFSDIDSSAANVRFLFSSSQRFLSEQTVPSVIELAMKKRWSYSMLKPGRYEIVPFLLTVQDGIPDALYKSFGESALTADVQYLHIPFKESRGLFHIIQGW